MSKTLITAARTAIIKPSIRTICPMATSILILFASPCVLSGQEQTEKDKVTFDDHIKPILMLKCGSCHNPDKRSADLDVSNFTNLMQGGASGTVIEPGASADSYLYQLITHEDSPIMPPDESNKLPDDQLALIAKWIDAGALENRSSNAKIQKPVMDIAVPGSATTRPEVVSLPPKLVLEPQVKTARPAAVGAIATSPWAPISAIAGQKQILLYRNDTYELAGVIPFQAGQPTVLKFSRNGSLLLAAGGRQGAGGKVYVWDVATGNQILEVGDEIDNILAADISSNHKMIALGGPQKMIRVYSTVDGSLLYEIKKHTEWITSLSFSPDSVLLATGDRNGGLHVWEADTGNEYLTLKAHSKMITGLSWRSDSNVLASGSHDSTIRLWEMENGGQIKNWGAHGNGVTSLEFTRDGHVVSCGRDRVAKLWKQDGTQVHQFPAMSDEALAVSFCDETQKLICGDWAGLVRVFQATDAVHVADFSPNPPLLSERLAQAQAQLAAAQAKQPPLAEQLKATVQKISEFVSAIEASNQVRTQAESKLSEGTKQLATSNQTLNSINTQQAALEKELNEKVAARPFLEQSHKSAAEAVQTLPGDKELETVVSSLATKIGTVDTRIAELKKLIGESTDKKTATEKQVTDLDQVVQVAQSEVTAATTQSQALESQKAPLIPQKQTQEAAVNSVASEVSQAQKLISKWEAEIEFKAVVDRLSDKLKAAVGVANTRQVELQQAEQKLKEMEQLVAGHREKQQSAQQQADEVQTQINELKQIGK